jgi:hypothetical protein
MGNTIDSPAVASVSARGAAGAGAGAGALGGAGFGLEGFSEKQWLRRQRRRQRRRRWRSGLGGLGGSRRLLPDHSRRIRRCRCRPATTDELLLAHPLEHIQKVRRTRGDQVSLRL